MKLIKFITHPVTLIICFLFIIISGEASGGFYFMYIMIALPHGAIHSILAVLAIITLLFSAIKYHGAYTNLAEPILNFAGIALMLLSLYLFFAKDVEHYNYPTFYQIVPISMLVVFGIVTICSLVFNAGNLKLHPPT
ncbi:MAG: hypothetical protein JWR61_2893 [Ferruginibacter sp.]|uniref:hypothetical protein n=1 Tax=Ferruginibacter sp. TaxID=1940288 RepID=UPI002657C3D7|nr:hypothetical protein [Ferruginibacter sp.]MDB5277938.1 hypothetical protein [Ferruginibacter sp.]